MRPTVNESDLPRRRVGAVLAVVAARASLLLLALLGLAVFALTGAASAAFCDTSSCSIDNRAGVAVGTALLAIAELASLLATRLAAKLASSGDRLSEFALFAGVASATGIAGWFLVQTQA